MGDELDADFVRIAPSLIAIANTAQKRVAVAAAEFVPATLHATGLAKSDVPSWSIDTRQWVGTVGDGRPTESLLYGAVIHTKSAIKEGASTPEALAAGSQWLSASLGSLLSDTARGVEQAATYARPVAGYVRMLTPPSCGRCVVLAGKWFRMNRGFERHPGCDCIHVPAPESVAEDMRVNAVDYLHSLDESSLAKVLGSKANARTWLEFGQDSPTQTMNQLINAYRKTGGIRTAQIYGKSVKYTLEGTTRRGVAYHQMSRVRALSAMGESKDGRYRRINAPRLMPESIFQIAENKAHAERLLRDHGWLGIT